MLVLYYLISSESDSEPPEPRSAAGAGFQIYQLVVVLAAGFHRTSRTCRAMAPACRARVAVFTSTTSTVVQPGEFEYTALSNALHSATAIPWC